MTDGNHREIRKLFEDVLLLSSGSSGLLPLDEGLPDLRSLAPAIARKMEELSRENEILRRKNEELAQKIVAPRLLEKALEQSEAHFRLLTENAPDVVWRLDSNYHFTYISPSDERLRGFKADEVIGHHIAEIFTDEGLAEVRKLGVQRVEAERRGERMGVVTFEAQHRCKGGTWIWAEISSTPEFDAQGNLTGFYGISREFTQRKQAEDLLHQAKVAAEEASKAKSEFLALVSHEIRTPLNSLVGFSTLARATTDPVKLEQYHAILEQSSRSLMDLVNGILDMSKIEAGRMELENVPFNLHLLVAGLEEQYHPLAEQKSLEFRVVVTEQLPVWVRGDPVRVRQILANLLANAVKFTECGQVVCTILLNDQSTKGGQRLISFQVRDDGIGIPANKQAQLFQPFRQVDPSISRKYGGSGLGLAIVKSLVEMMGGRIAVESREGVGSCFSVQLPLQESDPLPEERLSRPVSLELGMVLVVEDNRFNRQFFEDLLTAWGQQVTLAEGGLQGLQLMEEHHFDLVLLDIRMPGMDGIEVARRIRQREQQRSEAPVPIIAVTADLDGATRQACLDAGINEVLAKPVIQRELARAMAVTCERIVIKSPERQPLLERGVHKALGDDPDRVRQYRLLLASDIDEELFLLQGALERGDRESVGRSGHTLKGLFAQMAHQKPVELAGWLQQNAPTSPLEQLGEMVRQLRQVSRFTWAQEESA
jgi:PAS domain S-box-containing protein